MLNVNQQTIAGAQQSVAKPTLFSNLKTGSISCPKIGRAARGLLSSPLTYVATPIAVAVREALLPVVVLPIRLVEVYSRHFSVQLRYVQLA